MKYIIILMTFISLFLMKNLTTSATLLTNNINDDNWVNIVNKKEKEEYSKKIDKLNKNYKLNKFVSNKDIDSFIKETFLEEIISSCKQQNNYYPIPHFKRTW